ncbi:1-hydroxycarotenoid 3,4-desaturase CrtD [Mangrovibacterium marinum]|uniref:Phytoene desaturase n=1 Tax=Mangrovibacterium marinum TaxID=1639118 RepID=A0A2T5BYS8_9BACT|nr:1-hydroxycarotenoid 3,4-desaturase CrtD [Mangrovibacterium marinum]PTN07382.1 phytoene desaturase [Mangrovibacterium marinum]
MKKVAVIGAGVGGLAVAIRLARMGYAVSVYEQASHAGGKLNESRMGAYRFDRGPSLFTMPELLDELLDPELRIAYRKLELVTRYFYEDGTRLNAYADQQRFARELKAKLGVPVQAVTRYLQKAAQLYRITAPIFIFNSLHRLSGLLSWSNLRRAMQLPQIQAFTTLHRKNQAAFNDPRLVQLFDRFATYNGSNPYQAPATLQVIAHLEHNQGAYFPDRGMYAIAEALQQQAEKLGVKFHFNTPVQRVAPGDRATKIVQVGGQQIAYDLVVSDVDVRYFYDSLLQDGAHRKPRRKEEPSSSALIFYWGMDGVYDQLDLHNLFFSADYEAEFDCLFRQKTISNDPTVYVYVSNKMTGSDAPPGAENWFVMVNAPVDEGQDWERLKLQTRARIVEKLERMLNCEIESRIVCEELLDPQGIEQLSSSVGGAIYGTSSNSLWSAFRRHPNHRKTMPGLYFVGGSVHPGGGIPLCLSSAKIVADWIGEKEEGHD